MIRIDIRYLFFQILWIMILLPRVGQFIVLLILFFLWLLKGKVVINTNSVWLVFFLVTGIFSLCLNFVSLDERFFAAINTNLAWLISIIAYIYYSQLNLTLEDKVKFQRISYYNNNILIIIALMSFYYTLDEGNLRLFSRAIRGGDWIDGEEGSRLVAFMEYPNLIVIFFLLIFPFAYSYVRSKHNKMLQIVYAMLSILAPILSASRTGLYISIIILIIIVFSQIKIQIKAPHILAVFLIITAVGGIFIFQETIFEYVDKIVMSREGSSEDRFKIYTYSIEHVLNGNIIFGQGIKEYYQGLRLGSHSTYIGVFYRTGIIGSIIFIVMFTLIFNKIYKYFRLNKEEFIYGISMIFLMLFFIFEDMDGANWAFTLFFMYIGLITNRSFYEKRSKE